MRTMRLGVLAAGVLAAALALPARAAVLDAQDVARLAAVTAAIQAFEDDVVSALHHLPPDAEQIEAYSYVKLNLEAAHERLNTVFTQVALSLYVEAPADEALILNLVRAQLLPASMAATHPANPVFAAYSTRASAILGDRAVPLLGELERKIAAAP
jgi:hypothetical protein